VYEAAQDAVNQIKQRAATLWKAKPEEVIFQDGVVSRTTNGQESLTLKELAAKFPRAGGPVGGRASVNPRGVGPAFATHVVDVAVDPETGKVDVLRLHRDPGRWQSSAPELCRRPDTGSCCSKASAGP
jgi:CO/xanthine dehydrogenase Mo-binding subunit